MELRDSELFLYKSCAGSGGRKGAFAPASSALEQGVFNTETPPVSEQKNAQALTINVSSIAQANGVYTPKPSDFLDFTCFSAETP